MGRFAPSPTGDLHLGSLLTAAASFIDARAHKGRWLLRIEDLDTEREIAGATTRILECLERFDMRWDGAVIRQSDRAPHYAAALTKLQHQRRTFRCSCSRQQLQGAPVYPGTCRHSPPPPGTPAALRFALDTGAMSFTDRVQGPIEVTPSQSFGDFIVKRRDGLVAYMLAVVVDDAAQGVTQVVRGADLLDSTPAQIQLQQALGYPQPAYAHVPVITEPDGAKLAKSKRSLGLDPGKAVGQLWQVFELLGLAPPQALQKAGLQDCWDWAIAAWDMEKLTNRRAVPLASLFP